MGCNKFIPITDRGGGWLCVFLVVAPLRVVTEGIHWLRSYHRPVREFTNENLWDMVKSRRSFIAKRRFLARSGCWANVFVFFSHHQINMRFACNHGGGGAGARPPFSTSSPALLDSGVDVTRTPWVRNSRNVRGGVEFATWNLVNKTVLGTGKTNQLQSRR